MHPLDEETNLDHWEGGERRRKGRGGEAAGITKFRYRKEEAEKKKFPLTWLFISFSEHAAVWFTHIILKSHNIPTAVFMGLSSRMRLGV